MEIPSGHQGNQNSTV